MSEFGEWSLCALELCELWVPGINDAGSWLACRRCGRLAAVETVGDRDWFVAGGPSPRRVDLERRACLPRVSGVSCSPCPFLQMARTNVRVCAHAGPIDGLALG